MYDPDLKYFVRENKYRAEGHVFEVVEEATHLTGSPLKVVHVFPVSKKDREAVKLKAEKFAEALRDGETMYEYLLQTELVNQAQRSNR